MSDIPEFQRLSANWQRSTLPPLPGIARANTHVHGRRELRVSAWAHNPCATPFGPQTSQLAAYKLSDAGELEAGRRRDHPRFGFRRGGQDHLSTGLESAKAVHPHCPAAEQGLNIANSWGCRRDCES